MLTIEQAITEEYSRVSRLVSERIAEFESEISELERSVESESVRTVNIRYDVSSETFEISDTVFGEAVSFQGKNFESVFGLWKRQHSKGVLKMNDTVSEKRKEVSKMEAFLENLGDELEIKIAFNKDSEPKIIRNLSKKYSFLEKTINA